MQRYFPNFRPTIFPNACFGMVELKASFRLPFHCCHDDAPHGYHCRRHLTNACWQACWELNLKTIQIFSGGLFFLASHGIQSACLSVSPSVSLSDRLAELRHNNAGWEEGVKLGKLSGYLHLSRKVFSVSVSTIFSRKNNFPPTNI